MPSMRIHHLVLLESHNCIPPVVPLRIRLTLFRACPTLSLVLIQVRSLPSLIAMMPVYNSILEMTMLRQQEVPFHQHIVIIINRSDAGDASMVIGMDPSEIEQQVCCEIMRLRL